MGHRREPLLHVDQIPADFPGRDRVWRVLDDDEAEWVEPGNSVICNPNGEIVAGPLRYEESILTAEVDLSKVNAGRRLFDPVGHYNRPDVFQLTVDTRPQRAVTIVADERVDPGKLHHPDRHATGHGAGPTLHPHPRSGRFGAVRACEA